MKTLEFLIYTIILFMPTYLIRFSIFGVPTNVLEVLVGIALASWLLMRIMNIVQPFALFIIRNSLFIIGISLVFLGIVLGIFVSPDARTSLGVLKGWFLVPLAFFIVARSVLDTREKKEKALWSLALSGIGVAAIGFFYWVKGSVTFDGRFSAFYESPNMLAMYIAPAFLITTLALCQKLKGRRQKFLLFCFVLLLLVLLLTRSVGALVGIGGALAFYFSTLRWGKVWGKLGIRIFIVIIVIGLLLPFSSLFFDPWEMGRTSIASRFMIWRVSIEMLKDHWLFGIGPGVFQEYYLAYQKNFPPFLEWAVPHPHNIFLTTWLYGGVVGLLGFFIILYGSFKKSHSTHYSLFTIYLIYLFIHGTIDNTLWRNDAAMIFSLMMILGSLAFWQYFSRGYLANKAALACSLGGFSLARIPKGPIITLLIVGKTGISAWTGF